MSAQQKKSKAEWYPTKFEPYGGGWRSSRKQVRIGSRHSADLSVRKLEQALVRHAHGDLIDLGCGNAPLTGLYRDRVSSYTWLDWPNSAHQVFALDVEANLNEPLPLADGCYDTVLLTSVLEHLRAPHMLFGEMTRILRKDGRIICGVPFLYSLHEEPHDYFRYTRYALMDFAETNGLELLELEETGGGFDVVSDVLCKMLGKKMRKPFAYFFYYLILLLKKLPFVGGFNEKMAKKLPLGYVAVYRKP